MTAHPLAAVVCGAAGLACGPVVPVLVRRLPPVVLAAPTPADPEGTERVDVAAVALRPATTLRAAVYGASSGVVLGAALGWAWPLVYLLPAVPLAVALALVDRHTRVLPSRLIYPAYPLVAVGATAAWLLAGRPGGAATPVRTVVGAAVVFALFYLAWFLVPGGMGFGDVRLSGVLGLALAYLGWSQLVVGVYAGFLLAGVAGGVLGVVRRTRRRGYPFGPFLLGGALVGVAVGRPVLDLFTPGGGG